MAPQILTDRLLLRPWRTNDARAALASYGDKEVARWLTPAMDQVPDEAAMGRVLEHWIADNGQMLTPAGRWAVELRSDSSVVGGATL
ncbi:MAG: GNAT family N-acetyltransferase, partial [Actinobacteria bacterium]|nr:GNAT family N-acetyltransferase [Actinomycetota bacterium]